MEGRKHDAIHQRGWLDTRQNIQDIFQGSRAGRDAFLTKLFTRNANLGALRNESTSIISGAVFALCYVRYPCHGKPLKSMDYIKSLTIGELMHRVLPENNFLGPIPATAEFDLLLNYLIDNESLVNRGKTPKVWLADLTAANHVKQDAEAEELPVLANLNQEQKIEYLIWLAYKIPKTQYLETIPLIVTCYLGVAKRGTMTERFAEKVSRALKDDLGVDITLDADVIRTMYSCFGRYVTAENAHEVFDAWLQDIPEHALRLRWCLQQLSESRLTAFITIGRAMRMYPDFPWARLENLTGGELRNFRRALEVVNGNVYYGFNRTLGAARSSLYSSVAYVAKELLIDLAGETNLRYYIGWIRTPKNPILIAALIQQYKTAYAVRMNVEADPGATRARG